MAIVNDVALNIRMHLSFQAILFTLGQYLEVELLGHKGKNSSLEIMLGWSNHQWELLFVIQMSNPL